VQPQTALPLKDIKPIVDVPDLSAWFFAAIVAAILLAIAAVLFWLRQRRKRRFDARRAEALRRLEALDFSDTKKAVYDFSLLGHFVTTPKNDAAFKALLRELEPYKFKKEVPPLDARLKTNMQRFIKEAKRG